MQFFNLKTPRKNNQPTTYAICGMAELPKAPAPLHMHAHEQEGGSLEKTPFATYVRTESGR